MYLLSVYFGKNSLWFIYFLSIFLFFLINNYRWAGIFFFADSYIYVMLIFMTIFILGVIFLGEYNNILIILSQILTFVCLLFFMPVNFLILYVFFELSIFPILIIILGYGSQIEKIRSAYYLIFYAVLCSTPFLYIYFCRSFYFLLVYFNLFLSWELIFILSLCFIVKFPVYFLHLWLPKAHVEAPTTARMLLAGLLLKLGTAGFLRIRDVIKFTYGNFWFILSLVGIIVGAFMCLFQRDAKAVAAYSSITHIRFVLFSLVIIFKSSKIGGCIIMLSHGYTSTLMFYLVGEFFHKRGSRLMNYLRSFMLRGFVMSFFMMFVFLSNGGLPPSLSFVSEFVVIASLFRSNKILFIILFLYFFVAFYYSIFILTRALIGGGYKNLRY